MKRIKTVGILLGMLIATTNDAWCDGILPPEQQQQFLQLQMQLQRLIQGGQMPPAAAPQYPVPSAPALSAPTLPEAALAQQLAAFPSLKTGGTFERFRDGFSVNGQRFIDPEGTITAYGFDTTTGDVTYVAQVNQTQFLVKFVRALTGMEPIRIAIAQKVPGGWQVQTVTGKNLSGSRLIPVSRGFVVPRENTGFMYIAGQGITNIAAPEDFILAGFQNGDIAGTGHVLIQKRPKANKTSADDMLSTLSALGSTLGLTRKEDYQLLNIATGKAVPLNIPVEGNEVALWSQCQQRNFLVAQCERADFFESLFDQNGLPNFNHYYWRISWFKTPQRPIVVAQENGLADITITDLATGKKVVAFHRAMGIAGFSTKQHPDGRVSITARMGFSQEALDDAVAFLDKTQAATENDKNMAGNNANPAN